MNLYKKRLFISNVIILQKENIPCQHVVVASGHENITDIALAAAVRSDSWIIIENIHCGTSSWLNLLCSRLERLRSQTGNDLSSFLLSIYKCLSDEL